MNLFERDYRIAYSDTDLKRRLRLSRLFTLLQEAAMDHATLLGAGRERTLDRGILWIVTLQQAIIHRMPVYDEPVRLVTWPGKPRHLLLPRFYRVTDAQGNALIEASSLWALMDADTRKAVFPEQCGIAVPGMQTGFESALPRPPQAPQTDETSTFAVPYSYVDQNGHMNNTRYFDLAEDRMPDALRTQKLLRVCTEYSREARLDEPITLKSERNGDTFLIAGECDGQKLFKLSLTYAPDEP
ncbi:MAG: hypothetical protein IKP38_08325 [Clostridia bacterium]|nr:hypothetical protein [Clostridia bacterium]